MGTLKLLTLPIGNLQDITIRALDELKEASTILAEDTRNCRSLLSKLGITCAGKNIVAFHDHNQDEILKYMKYLEHTDIILVSDAGSPVISDPAYPLIQEAIKCGHQIDTIPGVSAVICGLELSGLPPHPFSFLGFLPREKEKKARAFGNIIPGITTIFFESPHRIEETLNILEKVLPDCEVSLCRELTKLHQSVYRFCAKDFSKIKDSITYKGEMVLVLYLDSNIKGMREKNQELKNLALEIMESGATSKTLSKLLGKILDRAAKEIYSELLKDKLK